MGFHGKQIQPGTIDLDRLYTTGYIPSAASDLTTVEYVQALNQGLFPKAEARVRAVGDVNLLSPAPVQDGITMVLGDRIVLGDQLSPTENGIYDYAPTGLVRSADADDPGDLKVGTFVYIQEGATWEGFGFFISGTPTVPPNIDIGVDPIIFSTLQQQVSLTVENGLTALGNNVRLGGPLVQDTDIDGGGAYNMTLSNLVSFEISTPAVKFLFDKGGSALRVENGGSTEVFMDLTDDWRFNLAMNDGGGAGEVNASHSVNLAANGIVDDTNSVNAAANTTLALGAKYSFAAGRNHLVGDGVGTHGDSSAAFGIDTINYGEASITSGVGAQILHVANQRGGIAHGFSTGSGLKPVGVPYVTASSGAVNISRNTVAQTVGFGALAQDSVILGGYDHNIPANSPGSVILGGSGIVARGADPNQVYLPSLNITTALLNDDALTEILVRDPATGLIKYRTAGSLAGATDVENGISIDEGFVVLGGSLVQNTEIDLAEFEFNLTSVDPAALINFELTDTITTSQFEATYNSLALRSFDASNSFQLVITPLGGVITVGGANPGLQHAADYSAYYTNRSLVDKEYVDNALAAGAYWALAGVSTLTNNVQITNNNNYAIQMFVNDAAVPDLGANVTITSEQINITNSSATNATNSIIVTHADGTMSLDGYTASGANTQILINDASIGLNINGVTDSHTIEFSEGNGLVTQVNRTDQYTLLRSDGNSSGMDYYDTGAGYATYIEVTSLTGGPGSVGTIRVQSSDPLFRGITYEADFSANFVARSLVDKDYVDSAITGLTASNGLTNAGGDIQLGGTLTEAATLVIGDTTSLIFRMADNIAVPTVQSGLELYQTTAELRSDSLSASTGAYIGVDSTGVVTLEAVWSSTDPSTTVVIDQTFAVNAVSQTFNNGETASGVNYSTSQTSQSAQYDAFAWNATSLDPTNDNLTHSLTSNWSLSNGFQMFRQTYSDIQPDSLYAMFQMNIDEAFIGIYDQGVTGSGAYIGVSNSSVNADYTPFASVNDNVNNGVMTAFRLKRTASGTGTTNPNAIGIGGRLDYELLIGPVQQVVSGAIDNVATAVGAGWETKFVFHVGDAGALTPVMEIDKYGAKHAADYSANYTNRSLVDKEYVDSAISGGDFWSLTGTSTLLSTVTIDGATAYNVNFVDLAGFTIAGQGVMNMTSVDTGLVTSGVVGVTGSSATMIVNTTSGVMSFGISNGGGLTATDVAYARGIQYAADYSANYTARSLVDKAYVDALVTGVSASNGLTEVGSDIRLGGVLTQNTTVGNANNFWLSLESGVTTAGGAADGAFRIVNHTGIDSAGREIISISKRWSGGGAPDNNNQSFIGFYLPNTALAEKRAISIGWTMAPTAGVEDGIFLMAGLKNGANVSFSRISDGFTVLGTNATTGGGYEGVVIGTDAAIGQSEMISIGRSAGATSGTYSLYTISLGYQANFGTHNIGGNAIAIGQGTKTTGADTISIGTTNNVQTQYSIAMGYLAFINNTGAGSIAIGANSIAHGGGLAVGQGAQALSVGTSTAIGAGAKADNSTAVGYQAGNTSGTIGLEVISLGAYANQGTHNTGTRGIAIGYDNRSIGGYSVAIGGQSLRATGAGSIIMGYAATTMTNSTDYSFGLGWNASTTPDVLFAQTSTSFIKSTLSATANSQELTAFTLDTTYVDGLFTGVIHTGLSVRSNGTEVLQIRGDGSVLAGNLITIAAAAATTVLNFYDGTVTSSITHIVGGRLEISAPIGYLFSQGGTERLRIAAGGDKHVVANLTGDDNAGLITYSSVAANTASSDFVNTGFISNTLNRVGALMYSTGSHNLGLAVMPGASSPTANLLAITSNNLANYDGYMATISYALTGGELTASTSKPMLRMIKSVTDADGFDHTGAFIDMLNDTELTGDFIHARDTVDTMFRLRADGSIIIAAPVAGSASDDVLVRDAATGEIKSVTQASIGGGGSIGPPQEDDRDLVPAVTTGDEEPTGLTISNTPTGLIVIALNGEIKSLGNGVKTKHCYFSGDGGTTARAFSAIVATDELYWNGTIAGYDLDASDVIDFYYI